MRFENEKEAIRELLTIVKKKYWGFDLLLPSGCNNLRDDIDKEFRGNLQRVVSDVKEKEALKYLRSDTYNNFKEGYGITTITSKGISIHFKKLAEHKGRYKLPNKVNGSFVHSLEQYSLFLGYMGWKGFCTDPPQTMNDAILKYPRENLNSPLDELKKVSELSRLYLEKESSSMRDLNKTALDSLNIKKEIFTIIDDLWNTDDFIDTTLPFTAKDKLLEFYFDSIANASELKGSHIKILNSFFGVDGQIKWDWYERSMIMSALSLSFIKKFTELKANFLIRCINERDEEREKDTSWQKALLGLILGLLTIFNKTNKIEIVNRLILNLSYTITLKQCISTIIKKLIVFNIEEFTTSNDVIKNNYFQKTHRLFTPFHESIPPLINAFKINKRNVNTDQFAEVLTNTIALSIFDKYNIAFKYPNLNEKQINGLTDLLTEEIARSDQPSSELYIDKNSRILIKVFEEFILSLKLKQNLKSTYGQIVDNVKSVNDIFINACSEACQEFPLSAYYYEEKKDYRKAIVFYKKATKIDPNNFDVWFDMGLVYYDLGNMDKVIECNKEVVKINPDFYNAWFRMGLAYNNLSNGEKAIECFEETLKIKPDHGLSVKNISITYQKLGNHDEAKKYLKKAVDQRSEAEKLLHKGVKFCDHGEKDRAIDCYKKAINLSPTYHMAWYNMGSAYFKKADDDNAIECFKKAINIKPDDYMSWNNMGLCYSYQGKKEIAIDCYEKAIRIKPGIYEVWNNMGFDFSTLGKKKEAIKCYKKAIHINPEGYQAHNNLGQHLIKFGDIQNAEPLLLKAIKLGSLDYGNMNLGHVFLVKELRNKAIKHYRLSKENYSSKKIFWERFEEDYQYLDQYGIIKEDYMKLIDDIGK